MAQFRFVKDKRTHVINFRYLQYQDEHGLVTELFEVPAGMVITLVTGQKDLANDRIAEFMMNPASIKKSFLSNRYGYDPIRKSYDPNPPKVETTFVVIMTVLGTLGFVCLSALF